MAYPAGVDGGLDEEALLLVAGEVDGLHDKVVNLGGVAGELHERFVIFFEEGGGEVPQAQRRIEGRPDGVDIRLLSELSYPIATILQI